MSRRDSSGALELSPTNIAAVETVGEVDLIHGPICARARIRERFGHCCDGQDAASFGNERPIGDRSPGVKHGHPFHLLCGLDLADEPSANRRAGIAARGDNDRHRVLRNERRYVCRFERPGRNRVKQPCEIAVDQGHGDTPRYQLSATAGANFADDRGNVMFHLGYSDDKGLLSRERKNTRVDDIDYFQFTGDPNDYGTSYAPFFSSFTPQGRFFTSAGSFTFDQNGVLRNCFSSNSSSCGGAPNGFNRQFFRTLSTPVKRWLVAERGHFDITDNISFITEATYAKTSAKTEIEPVPLDVAQIFVNTARAPVQSLIQGPNGPVIVDNPLVPAAILAASSDTDGDGLKDIGFSRRLLEFGTRNYTADRDFFRFVTGFEGKLFNDRWNWDVTYNFGRTEEQQVANGDVNIQNFQHALKNMRSGPGRRHK